jgi:hypothetical protein
MFFEAISAWLKKTGPLQSCFRALIYITPFFALVNTFFKNF